MWRQCPHFHMDTLAEQWAVLHIQYGRGSAAYSVHMDTLAEQWAVLHIQYGRGSVQCPHGHISWAVTHI